MKNYQVTKQNKALIGNIVLAGSKSISNRVLIIRALCDEDFKIERLANAKDTDLLQSLLASENITKDAGPAGTTFRFLTAYYALQSGTQILTGSDRMKQRPIKVLVDALRQLGANISYLEEEGFPPLKIDSPENTIKHNSISIPADTSSQYISALLMIAPKLPGGLILELTGEIVSIPYIEMTLKIMEHFGVQSEWNGNIIRVQAQKYTPKSFTVEADWSAASYYYTMAAFANEVDVKLGGLFKDSLQGDAALVDMMTSFGIQTRFTEKGIHLSKSGDVEDIFEYDFIRCPDLAQSVAVLCAGLGVHGLFTGLQTLKIKETDRTKALQNELNKVNVLFAKLPESISKSEEEHYLIEGKAEWKEAPTFLTYEDHRMAMAFAPLAMLGAINIKDPAVVGKSYPDFWSDLKEMGFEVK